MIKRKADAMERILNNLEYAYCSSIAVVLVDTVRNKDYSLLKGLLRIYGEPPAEEIFDAPKISALLPDEQFYEGLAMVVFMYMLKRPEPCAEAFLNHYRGSFLEAHREMNSLPFPSYGDLDAYLDRLGAFKKWGGIGDPSARSTRSVTKDLYCSVFLAYKYSKTDYGEMSGACDMDCALDLFRNACIRQRKFSQMRDRVFMGKEGYVLFRVTAYLGLIGDFGLLKHRDPDAGLSYEERMLRYFNSKTKRLSDYILGEARKDLSSSEYTGTIKSIILPLIEAQFGTPEWFSFSINADRREGFLYKRLKPLRYEPDVPAIIDAVLDGFIADFEKKYNEECFERQDWSDYVRTLVPGESAAFYNRTGKALDEHDPQAMAAIAMRLIDKNMLLNAVYIDAMYHMFSYAVTQHYRLKLKELGHGFDLDDRDDKGSILFIDQTDAIHKKDLKIERLQQEISAYMETARLLDHKSQQELKASLTAADEKADEIDALRRKNEALELLVEKLQEPETEPDTGLDLGILRQFRFLFVGNLQAAGMKDLKKMFPRSAFMETETFNPNNVGEISAAVVLARYVSHAMTYRVDAMPGKGIKRIYYNGRNMDGLLTKMYEEMFG